MSNTNSFQSFVRSRFSSGKNIFALLITIIAVASSSIAQNAPPIEWQKSLGGSEDEEAHCIQQTADDGFVVSGYSNSEDGDVSGNYGNTDYWILKLDVSGSFVWKKTFGGSNEDKAYSIQQINDGGYIVAGFSKSNDNNVSGNHGLRDCWIVRLDASGNIDWQKSLGGEEIDEAHSIQQTTDEGFIVAGHSNSDDGDLTSNQGETDYWVVKLDLSGNIEWQKSLGGNEKEEAHFIQQTTDGGFITAGYSRSVSGDVSGNHGGYDYWIVKLGPSGNLEWQKCAGGTNDDYAHSIQQTADGGYVVAGSSQSADGDISAHHGTNAYLDAWIVKLDPSGNIEWEKSLGGAAHDEPYSIQQTMTGGFVVAGYSWSNDDDVTGNHGDADYWVVNLDPSGAIEWQKSMGGSVDDFGYSMRQTSDGGFILAGSSLSNDHDVSENHGAVDYWIAKLFPCDTPTIFYADTDGDGYGNANATITAPACSPPAGYISDTTDCDDANADIHPFQAEVEWQICLGDPYADQATSIQQTTDGGFIVTGTSASNYGVVKLDSSQNIEWEKSLGGTDDDQASFIQQTIDGGFIIAGTTRSVDGDVSGNHGADDYWVVKLDAAGSVTWKKCLGGSNFDGGIQLYIPPFSCAIQQTADEGFILAGYTKSNDGDVSGWHVGYDSDGNPYSDFWVVKMDGTGTIQWQKCLGGSLDDKAYSVQQTSDGGFIVAGVSQSNNGDVTGNHGGWSDYWIVKLDSSGIISWQKSLGGSGLDRANTLQQTADDGFIVAGYSESSDGDVSGHHGYYDFWIVKLASTGNIQWQNCLGGSAYDYASSIHQTTDSGYIAAGSSSSNDGDVSGNHSDYDYWIVKISPEITGLPLITPAESFSIYPNPNDGFFNVYVTSSELKNDHAIIEVLNILGQIVHSQKAIVQNGKLQEEIQLNHIANGMYLVKVMIGDDVYTTQIDLQK